MKKLTLILIATFAVSFWSTPRKAEASACLTFIKQAAVKCATDPKCVNAAAQLAKKFKEQVKLCKKYRGMLKVCRKAKKARKKV